MILIFALFGLFIHGGASSVDYFKTPVKPCRIGDVVENECIKCLCTSKTIFECLPINCDKQKVIETKNDTSQQICLPNQLYAKSLITCICNKDGKWPHKSCQDTFMSLPPSKVQHRKCDPDTYVVIDCNVCRCGPDGEFISNRCTKNNCDDSMSRRTDMDIISKRSNVYSSCDAKTWYSLAPCQFCYCVNENKLVCNTGNDETKKVGLGTYDMQVCGKDLLKEAIELLPEDVKAKELNSDATVYKANNDEQKTKKKKKDNENSSVEDNNKSRYVAKTVKKADPNISDMDYDSEEKKKVPTSTTAKIPKDIPSSIEITTQQINNPGSDSDDNNSNEITSKIVTMPNNNKESDEKENDFKERSRDINYNGETLQINLPNVLNKVFEMALRKSMVSLVADTACVPGATTKNGCNTCFCLKNGKLLCTSRKC